MHCHLICVKDRCVGKSQGFRGANQKSWSFAGIQVGDAAEAHRVSVASGAVNVLKPCMLENGDSQQSTVVSEVKAYGDVVFRYISGSFKGPFLPGYEAVQGPLHTLGLQRLDHCVGNAPHLFDVTDYLMKITGSSDRLSNRMHPTHQSRVSTGF